MPGLLTKSARHEAAKMIISGIVAGLVVTAIQNLGFMYAIVVILGVFAFAWLALSVLQEANSKGN